MRGRLVTAAAAAALVLGGCSATPLPGDEPAAVSQPVAASVLADAITAARAAGSARVTGTIATTGAEQAMSAEVSGVQVFEPPAADITVTSAALGDRSVRQLLVDGKAYVQVPELGGQWAAIDLAELAGMLGPVIGDFDPAGLPDLQPVGEGTVNGAAVQRYRADLDFAQAMAVSGLDQQAREKVEARLADDPGRGTVTLAVDDQGRLVQWQLDATVNLAEGGQMQTVADITYSDFGTPATITAPEQAQVIDLGSIPMPGRP